MALGRKDGGSRIFFHTVVNEEGHELGLYLIASTMVQQSHYFSLHLSADIPINHFSQICQFVY